MSVKNTGLGKGLSALLGDDFSMEPQAPASTLPISQVESNSAQPRKRFDEEKMEELAESIRQNGIIQPLTVRKLSSGYYQIIAGERRWRAARMAGLSEIPAVVIEADDRKAMELAMIENLQREDLDPIEEAEGYRALVDTYGMTQEQAATQVGKSRSAVANSMRLLALPTEIQDLVEDNKLTAGHGRALLSLPSVMLNDAVKAVLKNHLSVRQTEQLVKRMLNRKDPDEARKPAAPTVDYVSAAERDLSGKLGRACHISQGKKKGRVEIEYYGVEDLNQLLDALGRLGK